MDNKKKDTPIIETLADVIKEIVYLKKNTKTRNLFFEKIGDLKPKSCIVKFGLTIGKEIGFDCFFEKNGEGDIFTEIEKGIPNPNEIKFFLYGLNPEKFHFNPDMVIDDQTPNILYVSFKLKNDA